MPGDALRFLRVLLWMLAAACALNLALSLWAYHDGPFLSVVGTLGIPTALILTMPNRAPGDSDG